MTESLRVMGIDPSLTSLAIARPDGTTGLIKTKPADFGIPKGKRGTTWQRSERIHHIVDAVEAEIYETNPGLIAYEGYSYGAQGNALIDLGELGWALRDMILAVTRRSLLIVAPSNLKKFATGKGNAKKIDMVIAARDRLGYDGNSDDEADALWLRALAHQCYDQPIISVPKAHLDGLGNGIEWPHPDGKPEAFDQVLATLSDDGVVVDLSEAR